MAAHIVTALDEILGDLNDGKWPEWEQLEAACNHSCWTEDLSTDEWGALNMIVMHHKESYYSSAVLLKALVVYLLESYKMLWEQLGFPNTREEWNKRRFNL